VISVPPTRELRVADGPRHITRICAYMTKMHRVSPGATRTMLCRLAHARQVRHLPNHCYQLEAR
jgi:hypothetical protein